MKQHALKQKLQLWILIYLSELLVFTNLSQLYDREVGISYVWCLLLHLHLPRGNWLWLTNTLSNSLRQQEVGAQSLNALFSIIRPAFFSFMSDCIQLKMCPHLRTNGSIALLFWWQGCVCFVRVQQWLLWLVVLGCLLPCASPAWDRQLMWYTWALQNYSNYSQQYHDRKSSCTYRYTYVHLSSERTLGSRNSEPDLPRQNTADCRDHFLKDTAYKQHDHNHLRIPFRLTARTFPHLKFHILVLLLYCPGN